MVFLRIWEPPPSGWFCFGFPLKPNRVHVLRQKAICHEARVVSLPDADHLLVLGDFTGLVFWKQDGLQMRVLLLKTYSLV